MLIGVERICSRLEVRYDERVGMNGRDDLTAYDGDTDSNHIDDRD